jgi:hypothetical protein
MPESDSGRNQPLRIRARLMPESDSGRNKPLRYHGPPSCRSPTQVRNQPLRIRARLQSGRNSRTKENRASAPAHSPTAASSFVSLIPEVRPNPPNKPLRIRTRLHAGVRLRFATSRFVSGPDFSRAATAAQKKIGLQPPRTLRPRHHPSCLLSPKCGQIHQTSRFVSGPDFSRAVTAAKRIGLQPPSGFRLPLTP